MARQHGKTMIPVESSLIDYMYYDFKEKILHILFTTGGYYVYYNVNKYRYYKFRHADSKGRYFRKYIREKYEYRRIR